MNHKTKCIYCGATGPLSKEHALPYSLGRFKGFPELINRVCQNCNSGRISIIEDQFLHSGPEAFIKKLLGIKGRKKHKQVNIFKRGSAGAPPIDFIGYDAKLRLHILFEFNPGQQTVGEVDEQMIFVDTDGNCYPHRVPNWIKNNEEYLDYVKKTIPQGNYDVFFFGDSAFLQRMRKLSSSLGDNFSISEPLENTTVKRTKTVYRITDLYFRAIAKIAFHYFLTVVDIYRGNEDIFRPIRDFIINGGVARDFVKQKAKKTIQQELPSWWTHIIKMECDHGGIFVYLQFFVNSRDNPLEDMAKHQFMVRLNRDIDSLALIDRKCHHFVYYKPIQKIDGYYGEVVESKFKDLYLFR